VTTTALCALLGIQSVAADPDAALLELASGRFVLAEAPASYGPRLDTAVEKALASLNFAFRPFARYKLRPAVYQTVCPELAVQLSDQSFTVQCGAQPPVTRPLGGDRGVLLDDGDEYEVLAEVVERGVCITYTGEKGGQTNSYLFREDGGLQLRSSIFSASLPQPLRWSLSYRRLSSD